MHRLYDRHQSSPAKGTDLFSLQVAEGRLARQATPGGRLER